MNPKFERQARLKEVGAEGQRRLAAYCVTLIDSSNSELNATASEKCVDLELWLAREYLERAGVGEVRLPNAGDHGCRVSSPAEGTADLQSITEIPASFGHAPSFDQEIARSLATGAWRALRQVRTLLELAE